MLVWAVGALAEGLGIRAVARVFEVDPNTVLHWLVAAADHLTAFSQYFLHDVRVTQVQLDELYALLCAVKDGEVSEAEALRRLSRSPHWVWAAIDPVSKLLLTIEVGERTRAMAQRVVHQVAQALAPGCVPLFLTDGFKEYATALLTHFGHWVQPPRRQATGPAPKPRWMPRPQLLWHLRWSANAGMVYQPCGGPPAPRAPLLVCPQPVGCHASPRVLTRRRLRHRLTGGMACVAARRDARIMLRTRQRVRGCRVG